MKVSEQPSPQNVCDQRRKKREIKNNEKDTESGVKSVAKGRKTEVEEHLMSFKESSIFTKQQEISQRNRTTPQT